LNFTKTFSHVYQIGSETSYLKLAETISSDVGTVQRYVDLLEKSFIVFRLQAFSRNLHTELKKTRKVFFYDNGIRNAIIGDFRPLELRNDVGGPWENFMPGASFEVIHPENYLNFLKPG
jgi:hypothetical protein